MSVINIPEILLPENADMPLWAVNACDQFTSDLEYWQNLEKLVGKAPSTLNLIFPEIYLKDRPKERITRINETMCEYLDGGIFKTVKDGFIFVERTTDESGTRRGIVLSIDLECYSFEKGAKIPVRSTEATILERIPPRVEIRKNAPLELPHAMLLYNDSEGIVQKSLKLGETLYDFDLNMGGGHVRGTYINNAPEVIKAFNSLGGASDFLFAVGDGNHSLATAKTCWELLKKNLSGEEIKTHPARFALCEAVNIYDEALNFEPIHRLVKCADPEKFADGLNLSCVNNSETLCLKSDNPNTEAKLVIGGKAVKIAFDNDIPQGIRKLDEYICGFLQQNGGEVDYIHGEAELTAFTEEGGVGVILPPIKKDDFFELIKKGGNLPRKTFSMGEGNEKRYYIEAKLIVRR
ncbi:MAG: DUF1015 domain-containing protein [Clostridia bacterium]|nr:DUF1015 domain-containing protein [Clostridia bacterium]